MGSPAKDVFRISPVVDRIDFRGHRAPGAFWHDPKDITQMDRRG